MSIQSNTYLMMNKSIDHQIYKKKSFENKKLEYREDVITVKDEKSYQTITEKHNLDRWSVPRISLAIGATIFTLGLALISTKMRNWIQGKDVKYLKFEDIIEEDITLIINEVKNNLFGSSKTQPQKTIHPLFQAFTSIPKMQPAAKQLPITLPAEVPPVLSAIPLLAATHPNGIPFPASVANGSAPPTHCSSTKISC